MPDLSGWELAKQLRDVDDDLLIVFTTFYPEYMQESFNVQPFQFLTKPIDYTSYPGCSVVFLKSLTVVPEIL